MTCYITIAACKNERERSKVTWELWAQHYGEHVSFLGDDDQLPGTRIPVTGHSYSNESLVALFKHWTSLPYDWFMLVDDDTYVFTDRLNEYLKFFDTHSLYAIGDWLNWPLRHNKSPNFYWIGGGGGMLFSRPLVFKLADSKLPPVKFTRGKGNHDKILSRFVTAMPHVKRIHAAGFIQYGATQLDPLEIINPYVMTIHAEGDLNFFRKIPAFAQLQP